jgi:16S rRNA (cytidine1402-2'-O)-methyltransferase
MTKAGRLYLIPVPVGEEPPERSIPAFNEEIVRSVDCFFAEDAKTARKHLKVMTYGALERAEVHLLNDKTDPADIPRFIGILKSGRNAAVMSEAGCPGVADPGSLLVREAHRAGIEVVPLVGPSAILLSVMASGFNGQNFAFVGYLPVDRNERVRRLKELEQVSGRQSQFFIETPYRNTQLFEAMLSALNPGTLVFVGCDILAEQQLLASRPVSEWPRQPLPDLNKRPAVFGIYKGA